MLLAETVKNSVISILGADAAGRFKVIGYQKQTKSAQTLQNNNRLVQVWFDSGDFPKGSSSLTGPKTHDVTLKIQITVSQPAQADLTTLRNEFATDPQITTALTNMVEAASRADSIIDELWGIIFEILNDGKNLYLGQAKGVVSNRRLNGFQKGQPPEQGAFVVLTGATTFSFRVVEQVLGDSGNSPATSIFNNNMSTTADPNGVADPVSETEITVEN